MLFDSHTHIDFEEYTLEEKEALIKDIEASSLSYVVDIGCSMETSFEAVKNSKAYSWCYATVGVHPEELENLTEDDMVTLKELSKEDKVVAIGEIGLDYHYSKENIEAQQFWFRRQLKLANELKMPLSIHTRDADKDTMDILKEEGIFSNERKEMFEDKLPHVVIHCFSGSKETALEYIKLGAMIGFDGPITFKNNKKGVEVCEAIPLDRILIETDAPYLTPEPFRGTRNKSPYVEYVARKIAEIKGLTYEEVAKATLENAKSLFLIK